MLSWLARTPCSGRRRMMMTGSRHEYMLHESFRSKKIMTKMSIYNLARAHTTHTHAHRACKSKRKRGEGHFLLYTRLSWATELVCLLGKPLCLFGGGAKRERVTAACWVFLESFWASVWGAGRIHRLYAWKGEGFTWEEKHGSREISTCFNPLASLVFFCCLF